MEEKLKTKRVAFSSITGKIVSAEYAKAHPAETYVRVVPINPRIVKKEPVIPVQDG